LSRLGTHPTNQELLLKRSILAAALTGIALTSSSYVAQAQIATIAKPVQFGIAAGAALPVSDFKDIVNTGFNVTGTLGLNPALIPLGIRVDVAYNSFGAAAGGGNLNFTSVTGNLVYKFPSPGASPYAIGGAGWYHASADNNAGANLADNHFGWNLGGGVSIPLSGFDTFIEARYNQVQGDNGSLKFIPITFGILF
jgi:opacity protein-like surface antigen